MRSLLILEPDAKGHKLLHVRRIAREWASQGGSVCVATRTDNSRHSILVELKKDLGNQFSTILMADAHGFCAKLMRSNRWPIRQLATYVWIRKCFRSSLNKYAFDHLMVPYVDDYLYMIGLFGSPFNGMSWSCLVMSLTLGSSESGINPNKLGRLEKFKEWSFLRAIASCKTMYCIQEPSVKYLHLKYFSLRKKLIYLPDPIAIWDSVSQPLAREKLGLDGHDKLILVYGEISLRKGVSILLDAVQKYDQHKNIRIILAGRQRDDAQLYLKDKLSLYPELIKRVDIVNRFITDEEEHLYFHAVDIVWTGISTFIFLASIITCCKCGSTCNWR